MKQMICDTLLVVGALMFMAVLGAMVEHTMPLAAALGLLAVLAAGMRGIYQMEQRATHRRRRAHGRYRPAHDRRPARAQRVEQEPLRAA